MTSSAHRFENSVPIFNFEEYDGVRRKGQDLQWKATTETHQVFVNADTGITERFTHELLWALFNDQKAPMEHLPGHFKPNGKVQESDLLFLGDIPDDKKREKVEFQVEVCERFLRMEQSDPKVSRSDKKMKDALEVIAKGIEDDANAGKKWTWYTRGGGRMPSARTVRNWLLSYEEDVANLYSNHYGSRHTAHFSSEVTAILGQHVRMYASREKPTMVSLHQKMAETIEKLNESRAADGEEPLETPCLRTFQERVRGLPEAFVKLGRNGRSATSGEYRPHGPGMNIERPLQRIEMDEWRVDWMTILTLMGVWDKLSRTEKQKVPRHRLFITAVIDHATKVLLALRVHLEAPSVMTVLAALEMACLDKSAISVRYGCRDKWYQFGTPEAVVTDSATWYTARAVRTTVNDMKATLFLPPAGAASARGTIERFFYTSSVKALDAFTGRTFGSIEEKGDYDAVALACLPFDEISKYLTRFYVDVYHNTVHQGLHGETPKDAWERLVRTHRQRPPLTGRLRRHIFGINARRVLGRHGVRFLGITYQSVALQALLRRRREQVFIRVDRFDLGEISVWHDEGWITVPAVVDDFKGMSVWTWRLLCNQLRKLNLEKASMSRETLRQARVDLEAKGEISRLEAGIESPYLSDKTYSKWEKEMDGCVTIVAKGGNVPSSVVEKAVLAPEFYSELGISITPPDKEEGKKVDPDEGWLDPRTTDVSVNSNATKSKFDD